MCWSGEASAVLAAVGIGSTAYAAYKKEPVALWASLGYFSLMEVLQAYTYTVINECSNPTNQIATLLGYLHIAFQPFFINAVAMHFIRADIRRKIRIPVYALCFVSAIVMLIQLYPFAWAGMCTPGRPLCDAILCSVHGNWHIAWLIPTNGLGNAFYEHREGIGYIFSDGYPSYIIAGFLLPLLYGSWRMTLYHYLLGPFLAQLTTDNPNEWPAIWCLLSIGLLLIVVKTPVRRLLFVRSWWLWPRERREYAEK